MRNANSDIVKQEKEQQRKEPDSISSITDAYFKRRKIRNAFI